MSLVLNHNLMAANTARNLNQHYSRLQISTQRLSSGLRVNSAADDAAGLAIRELQRADIAALHQGARNANDAISMIQTADGALGVIDEKLIRMKELAEQAATGTYDSTQRLMIESEYQAMASEITRIANATDFNGVKLLDGTLSGRHDGSGLVSRGQMKIHFGTGNDSAEDYYYITIGSCTAAALGVGNQAVSTVPETRVEYTSPAGDPVTETIAYESILDGSLYIPQDTDDVTPVYIEGSDLFYEHFDPFTGASSGFAKIPEGWEILPPPTPPFTEYETVYKGQKLQVYHDELGVVENLIVQQKYYTDGNGNLFAPDELQAHVVETGAATTQYSDAYTISTQEAAQRALVGINNAIVSKDKIRAHLGAMQNRLENTITNLNVQAENLQAAESRISDVDVATEMTQFVRNQILAQASVAMLGQANSLPQMAMQLIGG